MINPFGPMGHKEIIQEIEWLARMNQHEFLILLKDLASLREEMKMESYNIRRETGMLRNEWEISAQIVAGIFGGILGSNSESNGVVPRETPPDVFRTPEPVDPGEWLPAIDRGAGNRIPGILFLADGEEMVWPFQDHGPPPDHDRKASG